MPNTMPAMKLLLIGELCAVMPATDGDGVTCRR